MRLEVEDHPDFLWTKRPMFLFQIGAIRRCAIKNCPYFIFKFLFQIGAIRRVFAHDPQVKGELFLFQIGAIRRYCIRCRDPSGHRFYSKLVRLEDSRHASPGVNEV